MNYEVGQVYFWNNPACLLGKVEQAYNNYEFGRSDVTHCGIITRVDGENIEITEAGNKVNFSIYPKTWLDNNVNAGYVKIKKSKIPLFLVREIAQKYVGTPYGWFNYVALAAKLLGIKWGFSDGPSTVICSEFVARILYECSQKNIDFEKEYPAYTFDEIAPEQIYLSKFLEDVK